LVGVVGNQGDGAASEALNGRSTVDDFVVGDRKPHVAGLVENDLGRHRFGARWLDTLPERARVTHYARSSLT
jgi:hypothetical protein